MLIQSKGFALFCQKCGVSNAVNAAFCSACGASLAAAPTTGPNPTPSSNQASYSQRKDPIVVAVLCFIFGLGYLYLGYRRVLGLPTILFVLIALILYVLLGTFTFGLLELIVAILLAYDGYVKAKGDRGYIGTEPEYIYSKPA